jgi:hypothetical protein
MNVIENIYYRFYSFLKSTSANDVAEYVASIWLCILLGTNIIVILKYLGFNPIDFIGSFKAYAIVLYFPLLALMYFMFIKDKRFLVIEKYYSVESFKSKVKGMVLSIIYIIITFALLLIH